MIGKVYEDMRKTVNLSKIKHTAENYYRNGDFYCSEAIVKTIRDYFALPLPDDVIAMASRFPVGIGHSGCTCGAVSGGVMSLGMFFGRTQGKDTKVTNTMELSHELHDIFRKRHKVLCGRILTKGMTLGSTEHLTQCITGEVAEETARIISRELHLRVYNK